MRVAGVLDDQGAGLFVGRLMQAMSAHPTHRGGMRSTAYHPVSAWYHPWWRAPTVSLLFFEAPLYALFNFLIFV
jgi:hypothetical protein